MADKEDDILQEARERFQEATDAWSEMQNQALDDMKFGLLGEQWPEDVKRARMVASRPCMTINRQPSFIRQVVNDGRQNRPAIKVRPMDNAADVATSEIESGLIRHIESISDADIAYDTALQNQTAGGFGFVTVDVDYACDDSFDKEIKICAVPNPLAVLWDANTQAHDSSDWDYAFVHSTMSEDKFKRAYPKNKFDSSGFEKDAHIIPWFEGKQIRIATYYDRVEKPRTIVLLSDGSVVDEEVYIKNKALFDEANLTVVRERESKSYEVAIRKITGVEVLSEQKWRIDTIPVIPFYGDTFNIEGRWYHNSLIHDAKDSQRIFNYSRSTATELISLAPKVPFIGKKGAFTTDQDKWATINTESYPYVEYDGMEKPERQPFAGVPTGALQEAELASEDMKAIIGMSNPSLGMPDGRVISGKAKRMERHEADTSTFHFTDNQHRGIRACGKVILQLIPQVYTGERVLRILGVDGKPSHVQLGKTVKLKDGTSRVFDLTVGKYDLSVEAGPSYTTRREEAVDALSTIVSAAPQTAPILAPQLVKMFDMPDSEKITAMLATTMPPAARAIFDGTPEPPPQPPPEILAEQRKFEASKALEEQKFVFNSEQQDKEAAHRQELEEKQAQADIVVINMKTNAEIAANDRKIASQERLAAYEARIAAVLKILDHHHDNERANQAAMHKAAQVQIAQPGA